MFDAGTDLRFGSVRARFRSPLQHRLASLFLAMDATDLAFANEAKDPADRHTAFVAEARDGDVDTRLANYQGLTLANFGGHFAGLDR